MKRTYETPMMFAESFIANQYVAACTKDQQYGYDPTNLPNPTEVKCESAGHQNTQKTTMFTDSQNACIVKFVPDVGTADTATKTFHTKFNACYSKVGCNSQNWEDIHYEWEGWGNNKHKVHSSTFIDHDTTISLDLALKFNLS